MIAVENKTCKVEKWKCIYFSLDKVQNKVDVFMKIKLKQRDQCIP